MAKDLKYFMREHKEEIVSVPGPETFTDENGKPIILEIKTISNKEIRRINENYRRRSIALNKDGAPYVQNNEVVFMTEEGGAKAVGHILAEALVYPNLKDKQLMDFYKCVDITEMAQLVFSRADEYVHVQRAVFVALGLSKATDKPAGAVLEDAKN